MVEPRRRSPSRVAGLLVDRVSDVLDFAAATSARRTLGLGGGSRFVRGLIRHQERFLLIARPGPRLLRAARRHHRTRPPDVPSRPRRDDRSPGPSARLPAGRGDPAVPGRTAGHRRAQRLGLIRSRLQARLPAAGIPSFTWFHDHHLHARGDGGDAVADRPLPRKPLDVLPRAGPVARPLPTHLAALVRALPGLR